MIASSRLAVVLVLGTTQTLAWASTYYLPAILADRIAGAIGTSSTHFFAAFSTALIVSALVGPRTGRTVDAIGGREVLAASNVIIAIGLVALAFARGQPTLWIAWLILGLGMGIGLYDTAFAALGRIYGVEARSAITGITVIAGFASTLGWPLTAWAARELGWRETCLAWAAANLLLGLPLNLLLLPKSPRATAPAQQDGNAAVVIDRSMAVLGFAFAVSWMVVAAMAVHLPRLLEAAGASSVEAVAAGALIGPAQVAARIAEASLLKRFHPMLSARLAVALHPIGAALLSCFGAGAASGAFTILHGAGSGILTIARGTLPLALFGPQNYGHRLGLLGAPSRVAMALAPVLFAMLIERFGAATLLFSSGLNIAALLALLMLPTRANTPAKR
jgi:predicted MFS family arabinose efflux permease